MKMGRSEIFGPLFRLVNQIGIRLIIVWRNFDTFSTNWRHSRRCNCTQRQALHYRSRHQTREEV